MALDLLHGHLFHASYDGVIRGVLPAGRVSLLPVPAGDIRQFRAGFLTSR